MEVYADQVGECRGVACHGDVGLDAERFNDMPANTTMRLEPHTGGA